MAQKDIKIRIILEDDLTPSLKKTGSNIKKETAKASKGVKELESSFSNLSKAAIGFGAAFVGMQVFSKVTSLINSSTEAAKKQIQAEAKLEQVLKATGHAAGLTADELKRMAAELQGVTTFGDEATIEAQSLLLTFRNIGEDVFPRAIKSIQDTATMFGGLDAASIQLGKALNSPKEGLTALRRVGITFSEQQEKQIKQFQEMGQISKAQVIILEELENQFGGVAEAMAKTPVGKLEQANNRLGDIKETLGQDIIPLQTKWVELQIEVVSGISDILKVFGLLKQEDTIESLTQKIEDNNTAIKFHAGEVEKIGNNWLMGVARKGHQQSIEDFTAENVIIQQQIKNLKALNEIKNTNNDTDGGGGGGDQSALLQAAAELEKESKDKTIAIIEDMANRRIEIGDSVNQVIEEQRQTDLEQLREYFEEQDLMMADFYKKSQEKRDKDAWSEEQVFNFKLGLVQSYTSSVGSLIKTASKESERAAEVAKGVAIFEAIINTAVSATKAYNVGMSAGYPQGLVLGPAAAIAAGLAGGAQIATIASAKFADGGVVPGNSFSGDRVTAGLNSGELVLNQQQQQNMFNAIKSGNLGGGGNISMGDIIIEGNADESTVQAIAQTREDQLEDLRELMYELQMSGNLII